MDPREHKLEYRLIGTTLIKWFDQSYAVPGPLSCYLHEWDVNCTKNTNYRQNVVYSTVGYGAHSPFVQVTKPLVNREPKM